MRVVSIIIIFIFSITAFAQSGLKLTDGAQFKIVETAQVVVQNQIGHVSIDENSLLHLGGGIIKLEGNWFNSGVVNSGTGIISMAGLAPQSISNVGNSFYNLEINNPKGVSITSSTTVSNNLFFKTGDLFTDLKDTLYLNNTGSLVNESENGFLRGRVQSTSYPYFGNSGLTMSSNESLGTITVIRSSGLSQEGETYAISQKDNSSSIDCIWSVKTDLKPTEFIDYTMSWLALNDNLLSIDQVQVWHNNFEWQPVGTVQNGDLREVQLSSMETGDFTVGRSLVDRFIPTGFTPDGDGTNDKWEIPFLTNYPSAITKVFDRVGQMVFSSEGANYWDGTFNNKKSPTGAYYYSIDLNDGTGVFKGNVNIIRID